MDKYKTYYYLFITFALIFLLGATTLYYFSYFHLSFFFLLITLFFYPGLPFLIKKIIHIYIITEQKGGERLDSKTLEKEKHFFNPKSFLK